MQTYTLHGRTYIIRAGYVYYLGWLVGHPDTPLRIIEEFAAGIDKAIKPIR